MDELARKYLAYLIGTPVRAAKELFSGGRKWSLKPNSLLLIATTIFVYSLAARTSLLFILAAFAFFVFAWANKMWIAGDWRNRKPF